MTSTAKKANLMVRLDAPSKALVSRAASLRKVSMSDYVRSVVVARARREVEQAEQDVIGLTPEEQLAFWHALNEAPALTLAQHELAAIMRGDD